VHEGPNFAEDITCEPHRYQYSLVTSILLYNNPLNNMTDAIIPIDRWLTIGNPICILSISLPAIFMLVRRCVQYGPVSLFSSKTYNTLPGSTVSHSKKSRGRDTESMTSIQERRQKYIGAQGYDSHDSIEMARGQLHRVLLVTMPMMCNIHSPSFHRKIWSLITKKRGHIIPRYMVISNQRCCSFVPMCLIMHSAS